MKLKNYLSSKNFILLLFIILMNFDGLAQPGLDANGKLDNNSANVVDKNGAKGAGNARTIYGQQFSKPLGASAICDGTQPTTVVEVTSSTGKVWMDRNLGASRDATASGDFAAYGCLYQWGRGNDGHSSMTWTSATSGTPVNGTTATPSSTDTPGQALFITSSGNWRSTKNDLLWQGTAGVNNPCPPDFRLPTQTELQAEITAYSIANKNAAYASILKLVPAGLRSNTDGVVVNENVGGYYWTSTISFDSAMHFSFSASQIFQARVRSTGLSVRCIKN